MIPIKLFKTDFFRANVLNGIANIIKIITGIISNKIVAIYLGPSGIALFGQFQNFTSIVLNLANFGINAGITKYVAENYDNSKIRKEVITTGFYLILIGSLIASIYVFVQRYQLARTLLNDIGYSTIFVLLSLSLFILAFNSFLISILNGLKQYKKYVTINITSSFLSLIIAIIFVIKYGIIGAFISWILSQGLLIFVTFFWTKDLEWFSRDNFVKYFNKSYISKLLKFSLMTLTSLFTVVFVQLQIRTYLINNFSVEEAGFWQGIVKVSDLYSSFIINTLSIYYLPRISELKTQNELKNEVFGAYKLLIPILLISSFLILLFKNIIIEVLFSKEFTPMNNLFYFQILGNIMKVSSFIISYIMVAKAMVKDYIISEIISSITYYLLMIYFVNKFGIIGATYAYFAVYLLYFNFLLIMFRKLLFSR